MSTHPLCGKTFYFLGSSVTYGEPDGVSFVEHLARRTGCHCIKNAVSGTVRSSGRFSSTASTRTSPLSG